VKYVTSRLTPDRVEKTAYCQGESPEFVADWLEKNNLSKLKSVFEGTFIIKLLNECAFDAYSNGWRSSQTKKYFFSVFMYILRRLKTDAQLYIKQRSQSSVHSYETS